MSDKENDAIRLQFKATAECFTKMLLLRFGTVTAFAFIVALFLSGRGGLEQGLLLIGLALPLWIIELRNRSMHWAYRGLGLELEEAMRQQSQAGGGQPTPPPASTEAFGTFFSAASPKKAVEIRILFFRVSVRPGGLFSRVVTHTVGVDLLFLGTIALGAVWVVAAVVN